MKLIHSILSQKDVKLKAKFTIIGESIKLKQQDKKFFTRVFVIKIKITYYSDRACANNKAP